MKTYANTLTLIYVIAHVLILIKVIPLSQAAFEQGNVVTSNDGSQCCQK